MAIHANARMRVHRVGLIAAAMGLAALLALPFGRVRPFRLASGEPVAMLEALARPAALLPVVAWLVIVVFSLARPWSRSSAAVRGVTSGALLVLLLWLSEIAAQRTLPGVGTFARYSIGAGVWASMFLAVAVVMDSRRGLGSGAWSNAVAGIGPLGAAALIASGALGSLGMAAEYRNVSDEFWLWTAQHILYAVVSMTVALAVGITLGILAFGNRRVAEPVFSATSVVQTIPGLAMVGILAVPLGLAGRLPFLRSIGVGVIGWAPVVVALTLYALLVLVRNTYVGLASVPEAVVDAGRGMGMTGPQLLRKVQLPLASPIMFSGTRTAFQQTIGNATLAYFVAAGSLGRPIFSGVSQQADDLVLVGSVALVTLALTTDIILRGAERLVTPARARGGGR